MIMMNFYIINGNVFKVYVAKLKMVGVHIFFFLKLT